MSFADELREINNEREQKRVLKLEQRQKEESQAFDWLVQELYGFAKAGCKKSAAKGNDNYVFTFQEFILSQIEKHKDISTILPYIGADTLYADYDEDEDTNHYQFFIPCSRIEYVLSGLESLSEADGLKFDSEMYETQSAYRFIINENGEIEYDDPYRINIGKMLDSTIELIKKLRREAADDSGEESDENQEEALDDYNEDEQL